MTPKSFLCWEMTCIIEGSLRFQTLQVCCMCTSQIESRQHNFIKIGSKADINKAVATMLGNLAVPDSKCSICLCTGSVYNPCRNKAHGFVCEDCIKKFLECEILGTPYGMCPVLTCPLCVAASTSKSLRPALLPSSLIIDLCDPPVVKKYHQLIEAVLSLQCATCHQRKTQLVEYNRDEILTCLKSLHDYNVNIDEVALQKLFSDLCSGDISIDECYQDLLTTHVPCVLAESNHNEAWGAFKITLKLIKEPERRANLQLRYLRERPFIVTSCCQRRHCFRCKSKEWHEGRPCDEINAIEFCHMQPCPQCGVMLTRGDGCDAVSCLCKHIFSWNRELHCFQQLSLFKEKFPHDTHTACAEVLCETQLGDKAQASAWRTRHFPETNFSLLKWARNKFGSCAAQWCATSGDAYREKSKQPAIFRDVQILYTALHTAEVLECSRQNTIARSSILKSLFSSDEDRADAVSNLLYNCQTEVTRLMYSYAPILYERAQEWAAKNIHADLIKNAISKQKTMQLAQFLALYSQKVIPIASPICTVSDTTNVGKWDRPMSNQTLIFSSIDTTVERNGNLSCYPGALALLSSRHCIIHIRLISGELNGNAISFGLATRNFLNIGNKGVGPTPLSWGLTDTRNPKTNTVSYIFDCGLKVQPWRKLKRGDLISIEVDLDKGYCTLSMNENEFTYTFNISRDRDDYVFAVTLANDHVGSIENRNWSMSHTLMHMTADHCHLFSSFIRAHRVTAAVHLGIASIDASKFLIETSKIDEASSQWELGLGQKGLSSSLIFDAVQPAIIRIICERCYPEKESEITWNENGEKMTWKFLHGALCWGYK